MASRRSGKDRAAAFRRPDYTLKEAADLIFGDPNLLDEIDSKQVLTRPISLDEILVDQDVQVRVAGLDEETVEKYVQILLNGGQFDEPIVLYRDAETGKLILSSGFHRTEATRRAIERAVEEQTLAPLVGEIRPGGRAAAIEYAEDANLKHGLKLSNADKRYLLERRVKRGHEWATWSNRAIAAQLGVAEGTIRNWRSELSVQSHADVDSDSGAQNYAPEQIVRRGADGKSYRIKPKPSSKPTPQRYVSDGEAQRGYEEEAVILDEPTGDIPPDGPRAKPRGYAAPISQPPPHITPRNDIDEAVAIVRAVATLQGITPGEELTPDLVRNALVSMLRASVVAMNWVDEILGAQEVETLVTILEGEWSASQ